MLLLLILLVSGDPANAGATFLDQVEAGALEERGHSRIHYDFDHYSRPPRLRIYPPLGCAVLFDRPFEDTWASDVQGQGSGRYYHYTPWGTVDGAVDKLIIANKLKTKEPVNLFFLFGEGVLEVILEQVDRPELADRLVRFSLHGGKVAEPEAKPKPVRKREEPSLAPELMALFQAKQRTKRLAHGRLTYNFSNQPFFVAFEPKANTPEVTTLEVVRAVPKRFGKGFKIEYPLQEIKRIQHGSTQVLIFPNVALNPGERLYFRLQVAGERNATFHKLRKRR